MKTNSVLHCQSDRTDVPSHITKKFIEMNKPILYCSKLSPAVRGVLLTAKAMDLELELRFVLVFVIQKSIVAPNCCNYEMTQLVAIEMINFKFDNQFKMESIFPCEGLDLIRWSKH